MNSSFQFTVLTKSHTSLISITREVEKQIQKSKVSTGVAHIFVMHTTCGLTVNENADPDVVDDLLKRLDNLAPWNLNTDRHGEGNSAAHLKSSLLGCSLSIPIHQGSPVLGTWQGIFLGEFDGPRTRTIHMTIIT